MEKYEENQDYYISHGNPYFQIWDIFGTYGKIKIFQIGKSGKTHGLPN